MRHSSSSAQPAAEPVRAAAEVEGDAVVGEPAGAGVVGHVEVAAEVRRPAQTTGRGTQRRSRHRHAPPRNRPASRRASTSPSNRSATVARPAAASRSRSGASLASRQQASASAAGSSGVDEQPVARRRGPARGCRTPASRRPAGRRPWPRRARWGCRRGRRRRRPGRRARTRRPCGTSSSSSAWLTGPTSVTMPSRPVAGDRASRIARLLVARPRRRARARRRRRGRAGRRRRRRARRSPSSATSRPTLTTRSAAAGCRRPSRLGVGAARRAKSALRPWYTRCTRRRARAARRWSTLAPVQVDDERRPPAACAPGGRPGSATRGRCPWRGPVNENGSRHSIAASHVTVVVPWAKWAWRWPTSPARRSGRRPRPPAAAP